MAAGLRFKVPLNSVPEQEWAHMLYRFADFELDTQLFELRRGGSATHVEPLVFDLIRCLAEHAGQVMSRDQIIEKVWDGRIVSDATVAGGIKSARRVLGSGQDLIKTVRGRGFQFVGDVERVEIPPRQAAVNPIEPDVAEWVNDRPSIAVLPLYVTVPDPSFFGVGDAVSQEVILELSRLHWMFVTARGSSFQFRDPAADLRSVSRVLGVRYVLAGTIAFVDGNCIVDVELCVGETGEVVWAQRFELPSDQILQLRSSIAANIVSAVEARIQVKEAIKASRMPTENLDAWSAYHRGLWSMYRFNKSDNEEAARLFHHAIAQDPSFARAYAGLSFTHFQNAFLNYSVDRSGNQDLANRYAEKSLELDPLDPFCNLTMGRSAWLNDNLESAVTWLERSIDLSPNYAFAIYNNALLSNLMGEGDKAELGVTKAIALSPIDPLGYAMLATRAMSHLIRGNYGEAAEWGDKAVRAPNAHMYIHVFAALAHDLAGQDERAAECIAFVKQSKVTFRQDDFFRAFPFRDDKFRALAERTLIRRGL